jgi:exopolyphosphatase/pppGpp-phosphohydrolase
MSDNIGIAKKFLVDYLRGGVCEYEIIHPWRKGWEFVIQHSLRVEAYAVKIINGKKHDLSEKEIENIRMATVLHDIGRMGNRENHAAYGAGIVRDWFAKNSDISMNSGDKEKIIYMIEQHSNKEGFDPDLGSRILKDADILDEMCNVHIYGFEQNRQRITIFFQPAFRQGEKI